MNNPDKITIWLIEDNETYRKSIHMVLSNNEDILCPHTFSSGESALQSLAHYDHPDILISDIGLPGLSGIETVEKVIRINPNIDVIMLTVHDEDDKVFNAICAGACGYLLKSATEREILNAVKQVKQGGSPMNAKIARKVVQRFSKIEGASKNYQLTNREKEILQYVVEGSTKKAMALELDISFHTVDSHMRHIYEKLQVHSRSEAVYKAVNEKLL
ncbi:MAG: response regulator transcription factor [Gracilimonas sp.]|nr:response regulator transcription factor [Gracilimonas sp.]